MWDLILRLVTQNSAFIVVKSLPARNAVFSRLAVLFQTTTLLQIMILEMIWMNISQCPDLRFSSCCLIKTLDG
jgi:hypothetical protein